MQKRVCVYLGAELGRYGFPDGHPFGPWRMDAFRRELQRQGLEGAVAFCQPVAASQVMIERFTGLGAVFEELQPPRWRVRIGTPCRVA